VGDPKFSPDGTHVFVCAQTQSLCSPRSNGKGERQLTKDTADDLFNGDIDWVYTEELAVRSKLFLVA